MIKLYVERMLVPYLDFPYWESVNAPIRIRDENGNVLYEEEPNNKVKVNKLMGQK